MEVLYTQSDEATLEENTQICSSILAVAGKDGLYFLLIFIMLKLCIAYDIFISASVFTIYTCNSQ